MFGLGMPEVLLILVVGLIVIGPKKLPDLAKSLGRALNEFKRATSDLTNELKETVNVDEIKEAKKTYDNVKEMVKDPINMQLKKKPEPAPKKSEPADKSAGPAIEPDTKPDSPKAEPPEGVYEMAGTDIPAELLDNPLLTHDESTGKQDQKPAGTVNNG
jgi:Tat protein translocase TatB subunit